MVKVCECCGHPLPDLEVAIHLTQQQNLILLALKNAGRKGATLANLVHAIHQLDPNGGPEWAEQSIRVQLSKMKPALKKFNLSIVCNSNLSRRLETI